MGWRSRALGCCLGREGRGGSEAQRTFLASLESLEEQVTMGTQ